MILSLRRLITQFFGSEQVEQIERIRRSGAERAARRRTPDTPMDKLPPAEERNRPINATRDDASARLP